MTTLYIFICFLLAQRTAELIVARRHETALRKIGAVETDHEGYRVIVLMHAAFFVSIILESALLKRPVSHYWITLVSIFAAAQLLRYWAIASLGIYWNTKILVVPGHPIVAGGPYRFFRHPNYIAVVIEIAVVPMLFSCYITAFVFTLLNMILLRRRVRLEIEALEIQKDKKMPDGITTKNFL